MLELKACATLLGHFELLDYAICNPVLPKNLVEVLPQLDVTLLLDALQRARPIRLLAQQLGSLRLLVSDVRICGHSITTSTEASAVA